MFHDEKYEARWGRSLTVFGKPNEPPSQGPAAYEISYELRRRGLRQADVARQLAVSRATLNNVLHGRATSYRVATHVASILERGVKELWPGRYEFKPRPRRDPSPPQERASGTGA